MITLFDLLVVAAVLGFAYWGWLVGLQAASIAALELVACLTVAVMLHEAVAGALHAVLLMVLGDWVPQAWSILLSFGLLAWGSFALVRSLCHAQSDEVEDDDSVELDIDPLSDRLAGAVAGIFGGVVFVGAVLVTLSMVPFLAGWKPSGDRLVVDVGKVALRTAGGLALERHDGRSLPLDGEPPSRASVASARLTSEPWFDADDDGTFSDADRFRDVDGNGTFSKDLYFEDVDADGLRRIGLIDKYVAGRWDASLTSDDRPRPDLQKPATTAPPPQKPAAGAAPTGKPASTTKPSSPKPSPPKPATPERPASTTPTPPVTEPKDEKPAAEDGKRQGDDF